MKKIFNLAKKLIRSLRSNILTKKDFDSSRPFTSQNTWKELTDFYLSAETSPRILEYGSGFSTYYHLENLMNKGGELVSLEHDKDWYDKIWNSFVRLYKKRLENYTITKNGSVQTMEGFVPSTQKKVRFVYHFVPGHGRTGCGTFDEFASYVSAPQGIFDTVVVDGRARKACVNYVLKENLLRKGGLLVLFEAGRGNPIWPKKTQMSGTYDYQPEVRVLESMGGHTVDGTGYDVWDGWVPDRKSLNGMANFVPMEACFYIKS